MTESRKPTLRDVARLAGVSDQTVSNVLNNHPNVRAETRERVLQAARGLNYRVNRLARSLKTSRSTLIALIVPSITNPIYAEVAEIVSRVAAQRGYAIMLANSGRDARVEAQLVEAALDHQVAGILLSSIDGSGASGRLAVGAGVPCVQLLNRDPVWTGEYFGANNVLGAREAVTALIALGHRRIGHLRGFDSFVAEERLRGYRDALSEAGIAPDPSLVAIGQFSRAGGAAACTELLDRHPDMTALFCASDLMAYGALDELARRRRKVPNDVSVIGFDDVSFSALEAVSLTTMRFDIDGLATAALDRLVARIERRLPEDAEPLQETLPCTLVARRSTAAPRRERGEAA